MPTFVLQFVSLRTYHCIRIDTVKFIKCDEMTRLCCLSTKRFDASRAKRPAHRGFLERSREPFSASRMNGLAATTSIAIYPLLPASTAALFGQPTTAVIVLLGVSALASPSRQFKSLISRA